MNFAKLNTDVAFGRSAGKIIWQPRIGCWYTDKMFANKKLPAPYTGMNVPEIYRSLGCSARLYEFNACFKKIEHPSVQINKESLNEEVTKISIVTPVGEQIVVQKRSRNNWYFKHEKWEIESEDELKVAIWREENSNWEWDQEKFDELNKTLGDLGAPTMFMPRMNVQNLYIDKMGIEKGIFAIYDWPDTVEAYFNILEESHNRLIDVINPSPIEIINFGENVHSQTLSPDLFLKYHLPACQRRCEKLHSAGKFVTSHWDGDTGPLLKYAKETGLDGIEAITPKPQGDVTLEQIKEGLGDQLFLIDGIPAIYFDDTFPIEVLIECTKNVIRLFAPKLILGISDEISSSGDLERVRVVNDLVEEYNSSLTI